MNPKLNTTSWCARPTSHMLTSASGGGGYAIPAKALDTLWSRTHCHAHTDTASRRAYSSSVPRKVTTAQPCHVMFASYRDLPLFACTPHHTAVPSHNLSPAPHPHATASSCARCMTDTPLHFPVLQLRYLLTAIPMPCSTGPRQGGV